MARTLVRHLAPKGHDICVTERSRDVSQALVERYDRVTASSA